MLIGKLSIALFALAATAQFASAQEGVSGVRNSGKARPDYANARPMPLPLNPGASGQQAERGADEGFKFDGPAGFEPGARGSGKLSPDRVPRSKYVDDSVAPQEFGTSNHPFTTAVQADATPDPYRRAGKLFFTIGSSTFVCSASLIKRGLIVTAAHCVSDFGKKKFYTGFRFIPAYRNGVAPFGEWDWAYVAAPTKYLNGKDKCAKNAKGVVCENDVAVIALQAQGTSLPGTATGWYGYAWNGYSFTKKDEVLITQLGYPVALNSGEQMMRTDSQGEVDAKQAGNTIIGSLQTGGSSGGPWLANFGFAPSLNGTSFGKDANRMVVVGTTSWGYTNTAVKEQGASPFTPTNIKDLVAHACGEVPTACN